MILCTGIFLDAVEEGCILFTVATIAPHILVSSAFSPLDVTRFFTLQHCN